jgi:hypothetical protein
VERFKYVGTTLTNQNYIYEEIKSRLSQRIPPTICSRIFCLPVCYPKICFLKYTDVLLSAVLCGCETVSDSEGERLSAEQDILV